MYKMKEKILWLLALYGAYNLFLDYNNSESWMYKLYAIVKPKLQSEDEEFLLAKDLALYMQCTTDKNYIVGNQFIVPGKKTKYVNASVFISYCLESSKELWKACDLDNTEYSIDMMNVCVHNLIEKKCR